MEKNNYDYLSKANKGPYSTNGFSNKPALEYALSFPRLLGHVKDTRKAMVDDSLYIFDMVPYILENFHTNPLLLLCAIVSPTFGISLFDVHPTSRGTNQKWFTCMEKIHRCIDRSLQSGASLERESIMNIIKKAHSHYEKCLDETYTSDLFEPYKLYLAIALMDVYHIYSKNVYIDVMQVNYCPKFILRSNPSNEYLHTYSAIFIINPIAIKNNNKFISMELYKYFKMVFYTDIRIENFLREREMYEVIRSRDDGLTECNSICFKIINDYTFHCLKCIQTSPIVKNKEDCMKIILDINSKIDKKTALANFFYFKKCIYTLIEDNLLEKKNPFCFKYGEFFSPIPLLIDG